MGLNCDAHFGVNTAQERDVSTFPPGGGMRHRGGAQNAPRLQGGPLHVGWRGREHLVYVGATLRGGGVDVRATLSPIPLKYHRATVIEDSATPSSPLLYHPTFFLDQNTEM